MSDASPGQMSHADRHDLDKLARWQAGLHAANKAGDYSFPACAIFLVSGEDRASHDIFRRYRSAFEELGGGFHHLVIFGQHGISTTQQAFLREVGMDQTSVPLLAIAPNPDASGSVYCIELPRGERSGDLDQSQTWNAALEAVGQAATAGGAPELGVIGGVRSGAFRSGSLEDTVNVVMNDLGQDQ